MFRDIMYHELKNIVMSPRFTAAFITCSILILLSVLSGIQHYKSSVRQYETINSMTNQEMREQRDWMMLSGRAVRKPEPLQIFSSGVSDDIGRLSPVNSFNSIKLKNSVYSDDPVYSIFRFIDFTFIVVVVLSLFALLFTYDLINGEAEKGTLQLVFANPLPKGRFLLAKLCGAWLGLVVPVMIPLLLSLLLLIIFAVPLTTGDWLRVMGLFFISILFFTFYIMLGALLSTLTKKSRVSFLYSLVLWVCFVFIIPRAGVILAGQMITVPSIAEIEGQRDGYAKSVWERYFDESGRRWTERNKGQESWSKQDREAYRDEHMWEWMEEEDRERKNVEAEIEKFNRQLNENLRNRKKEQEKLAFTLSRISPASAYQLAAINLAETSPSLKSRYEDSMNLYRDEFVAYKEKKRKESGAQGGIRVEMSSEGGFKIDTGKESGSLNLSDVPLFIPPAANHADAFQAASVDSGIIAAFVLLAMISAFLSFRRFDVR